MSEIAIVCHLSLFWLSNGIENFKNFRKHFLSIM